MRPRHQVRRAHYSSVRTIGSRLVDRIWRGTSSIVPHSCDERCAMTYVHGYVVSFGVGVSSHLAWRIGWGFGGRLCDGATSATSDISLEHLICLSVNNSRSV